MKDKIIELYITAINEDAPPSVFADQIWLLFNPVLPIINSRCCGRCDGVNDICVSDQTCDTHKELGCEKCFGKR